MNSETLIIDKKFGQSISLYWWNNNKKKIYIYPNKWDDLNQSNMTQFYPFIEELPDKLLKTKLIEKVDKGILICTEDTELKKKIKDMIPEIINENEDAKISIIRYT